MIFKLLRTHNIKIVQIQMLRDERGCSRGLAFVLCLDNKQREAALELNNQVTL